MRGLDNDDADRDTGNQPVAPRKVARAGAVAERHFRDRAASRIDNGGQQILMFRRIDFIVTTSKNSDGATVDGDTMGRLIDATCKTRGDDKACVAEIARQ